MGSSHLQVLIWESDAEQIFVAKAWRLDGPEFLGSGKGRGSLVLLTRWPSRPSKRHLKIGLQYMTSPEIAPLRPLPTLLQAGHRVEAQP